MKILCLLVVLVGLACAACGGGDSSASVSVPDDIRAAIVDLGGNPDDDLREVVPGTVYRTPNGYLFGYCGADPALTQPVGADICFSLSK